MNLIKDDKIMLSDLTFNNFQYENLVSIFPMDQADILTQSINNAILSKIYKELKLISEDKILITDGRTIVIIFFNLYFQNKIYSKNKNRKIQNKINLQNFLF